MPPQKNAKIASKLLILLKADFRKWRELSNSGEQSRGFFSSVHKRVSQPTQRSLPCHSPIQSPPDSCRVTLSTNPHAANSQNKNHAWRGLVIVVHDLQSANQFVTTSSKPAPVLAFYVRMKKEPMYRKSSSNSSKSSWTDAVPRCSQIQCNRRSIRKGQMDCPKESSMSAAQPFCRLAV